MKAIPLWCAACLTPALVGCNLFMPLAVMLPDTKKVPAEFARLESRRVLVLVWAEPETLFDYPYVRLELASYVGDKIRRGVPDSRLVSARKVEDFIQREPEAAHDPRRVGDQFEAEMVVYLELLEFQIRDPQSPEFLQGRIRTSVRVYDVTGEADETSYYELAEVEVAHPSQPVLYTLAGESVIRRDTYLTFAERVARKFYDHEEAL